MDRKRNKECRVCNEINESKDEAYCKICLEILMKEWKQQEEEQYREWRRSQ